jgi:hypothetical protein
MKTIKSVPLPPGVNVIGRYRMAECKGMVPGEIILCQIRIGGETEFVCWGRKLTTGIVYSGFYDKEFVNVLRDFLKRIEHDAKV